MEKSSVHCTDVRRKCPRILMRELKGVLKRTRTIAGYQNSKVDFTSSTPMKA
jgi:hypothetical protein